MQKAGDEDWGVLKTGGPNGFLVVMLLLCWWGRTETSHHWKAAVDEATACLEKMSNRKRPSGTAVASPRKSSRYISLVCCGHHPLITILGLARLFNHPPRLILASSDLRIVYIRTNNFYTPAVSAPRLVYIRAAPSTPAC
jgi:hypothetical protein